jgi:hypothetical protein
MGKESSYTWYYTFRSAMQQYGVLLIPVDQFKKDKSLCPRNYYGAKVDPLQYKDMADALYPTPATTRHNTHGAYRSLEYYQLPCLKHRLLQCTL